MTRLASCCLVVALAACPKTQPGAPPQPPPGAGCPSGAGVYTASFVSQDASKGRTGWVVPLHAMPVQPGAEIPDYAPLDDAAASVSGVPAKPVGTPWLVTATGEPCAGKIGGYYAAKIAGPPTSVAYGVELEGCQAPSNPEEAGGIVLVSDQAPTACRFEVPQPVAARLGEMDANKQWQRPTKETPIPPALASAIPAKDCKAPACEMLWAFGEVKAGAQTVGWSGAVNWLSVGEPAAQCKWPAERFSGFFVPDAGGAKKITEGQDHPLVLSAVLADRTGPKVLLAEGPGEYATYDLVPGGAKLAHSVKWMLAPADAWDAIDHLGPFCEPEPAKPAPLPKDAKPISPYK